MKNSMKYIRWHDTITTATIISWNCRVEKQGSRIVVTPDNIDVISSRKRKSHTLQKGSI